MSVYTDNSTDSILESLLASCEQDDRIERSRFERRGADGLTKDERQHLYRPEAYRVERTGPIQFRAVNANGAEFAVSVIFGRFARVTSNTGNEYLLRDGACHCAHKQNGAATCKHEAATAAVMVAYRQDPIFAEIDAEIARVRAARLPAA